MSAPRLSTTHRSPSYLADAWRIARKDLLIEFRTRSAFLAATVFAVLAVVIVSRRTLFRVFQIPSLIFVPLLFWWISGQLGNADSLGMIKAGIFVAGVLTVAQFSFWGNYIPLVFPVHLRGTGESFAANIGGRVLGTAAAWLTLTLSASDKPDPARVALVGRPNAGKSSFIIPSILNLSVKSVIYVLSVKSVDTLYTHIPPDIHPIRTLLYNILTIIIKLILI